MAKSAEQEMLEALQDYDTPSITNVVATYSQHPLCLGLYNPWSEHSRKIKNILKTLPFEIECVKGKLGRIFLIF